MRGIDVVQLLFVGVMVVILAVVAFSLASQTKTMYAENATALMKSIVPAKAYSFDESWLIVNTSDPEIVNTQECNDIAAKFFGIRCYQHRVKGGGRGIRDFLARLMTPTDIEPAFCLALKDCIKNATVNGEPCEMMIPPIYRDTSGGSGSYFNLGKCKNEDLLEQTSADAFTKVCKFKNTPLPVKKLTESSSCSNVSDKWRCNRPGTYYNKDYDKFEDCESLCDPFYNYEPDIHGCVLPNDFSYPTSNQIFSYDPPSYGSNLMFKTQESGGRIRTVVANARPANDADRTCSYNLFTCSYQAIATSEDDSGIEMFEFFRDLPTSELDCYFLLPGTTDYSCLDRSDPYVFNMSKNPLNIYQLQAAINHGLWEWNRLHGMDRRYLDALVEHSVPELPAVCVFGLCFCQSGYVYDEKEKKCLLPLRSAKQIQFNYSALGIYSPITAASLFSDKSCWYSALPIDPLIPYKPSLLVASPYSFQQRYTNVTLNMDLHYEWNNQTRTVWVTPRITTCLRS